MRVETRLAHEAFAPERELGSFAADGAGAVVSFTGLARATTKEGAPIQRLFLDHHSRLTPQSLDDIATTAARFGVSAVRIVHRCGAIAPGEAIVFVAAAAAHRRAAFEAADYLMDRLKTDALFWKREDGPNGARWIEPREDDYAARERWSAKCPE